MTNYIDAKNLRIDSELYDLIANEVTPGTGVEPEQFWQDLGEIVADMGPKNKELLDKRDHLQAQLDVWFKDNGAADVAAQKQFLMDIGYLLPEAEDFDIDVDNVDPEISTIAGPQLVVPVQNSRFALNATNARWGSLYNALYGTDIIDSSGGATAGKSYNPIRGEKVIAYAKRFLDETVPLVGASYADVVKLTTDQTNVVARLADGNSVGLQDPSQFVGYIGQPLAPKGLMLKHNGLHIEIQLNPDLMIGKNDPANIKDVMLESALTAIRDFEDSVAAVDAADKVQVYRNWLGLMKGDLSATFMKGGHAMTRVLDADKVVTTKDGTKIVLPGRSLLFARNVGIHMYTDAVTTADGQEIPEGFLDAMVSCLIAKHDLLGNSELTNSRSGSIYIVKPK